MTETKDKDWVTINLGNQSKGPYYCNYCNRRLDCTDKETGEYVCGSCNISYFPNRQNVKKANKFETPGPASDIHGNVLSRDKTPLIAVSPESWNDPKTEKLPEFYEALKKSGFKWTSFEER